MFELNFLKNFISVNFTVNKKIEIARGKQSEGVIILSSSLETKAGDLSRNSTYKQAKRLKSTTAT